MKISRRFICCVFLLTFIMSCGIVSAAPAQPQPDSYHLTGYVKEIPRYNGAYGIVGDDGKNYLPLNLPRQFRKEGLAIKFDYQPKTAPNPINWGETVQIGRVAKISPPLTSEERSAIYVLLKRLDAFNAKDLAKLQQIDIVSRQLTPEQYMNWLDRYGNFKLRYVEISAGNSSSIEGACYYTREIVNGMTLYGNAELAAMTFTLNKTSDGWKLAESSSSRSSLSYESDPLVEIKQKAISKYGVDDLSNLWR